MVIHQKSYNDRFGKILIMNTKKENNDLIELAQKYGLILQGDLTLNEIGLDFRVAFARDTHGTDWVLRIPRREDVLRRTVQESRTLTLVKQFLPVEVPNWKIYKPDLIAYPRLSGRPAVAVDMEKGEHKWQIDLESPHFGRSFGETLAALHGIDTGLANEARLKISSPEKIRQDIHDDIERVNKEIGVGPELLARWNRWLDYERLWNFVPSVVHGDIHQAHLLVNDESTITGVLD